MKMTTKHVVTVNNWDDFVKETYQKPYCFYEQEGWREGAVFSLTVPSKDEDFKNDSIIVGERNQQMGVSFKAWLAKDVNEGFNHSTLKDNHIWKRYFYPDVQTIANDLHSKGLIPAGNYLITLNS